MNVYAVSESERGSGALQVAMNSPRTVYRVRADVTPEAERDVLADVFRFVLFESRASKKEAAKPTPESDGRKDGPRPKEIPPMRSFYRKPETP